MSHVLQLAFEIAVRAAVAVVDDLVRHAEMPGAHGRVNAAHGVDRKNRLAPRLAQRPEIGAVIDLMRRNAMRLAVPGKKQHLLAGVLAAQHRRRRRAIGRVDIQRRADAQAVQLGQAGTADNGVDSHPSLLTL